MKTILATLLIASTALADPKDAPTRDLDAPGRALVIEAGTIAPFDGVLLDSQEDVRRERRAVRAEGTLAKAEADNVMLPKAAFVAIVVGCVVASLAIGAGVTAAVKK